MVNKKQAILLSVMCLWFATAFIISCYHPRPVSDYEARVRAALKIKPAQAAEWKFHWPSERRQHEDLTKLSLLVLPVFAICVPLWFIFRFSVLPRRAPTLKP